MLGKKQMKFYGLKNLRQIPQIRRLSEEQISGIELAARVFPFRVNNYVLEELIDWENIPDDPIFRLTFPMPEMLEREHYSLLSEALRNGYSGEKLKNVIREILFDLNPHPDGQLTANIPRLNDEVIKGIQHKYRETVLVFPSSGQTCHSYCTFCFRWAQFIGVNDIKFATDESRKFQEYLKVHKEVTDVLFTGGDPMIMKAEKLKLYIEPLLGSEFEHIQNIRIGTKSITYWPFRYIDDADSDEVLALFEKIVKNGKHLAVMAHFNHWREFSTESAHEAIRRIRNTGAEIRTQSPVIRHINDDPAVWERMWKEQVKLGMIPYYMFVERDTGAHHYFAVPLVRAVEIFRQAYNSVSGLSRTVRGPSMSATPGKIAIEGVAEIRGEKVFVLNFLQGRNPDWVKRPFFAKYDEKATWLDDLEPAFGETKFFFEDELEKILKRNTIEAKLVG